MPYATAGVTPAVSPAEPRLLANPGARFLSENMQHSLLRDPRVGIGFILAYVHVVSYSIIHHIYLSNPLTSPAKTVPFLADCITD